MMPVGNNVGEFADALRDTVVDAAWEFLRHFLPELGDTQLRRMDDFTVVDLDAAGDYFQQRRFAAAVASHQAYAFSRFQRQVDAIEQRLVTVAVVKIFGL